MHPRLEQRLKSGFLALGIGVGSLGLSGCANQLMYHVDGINPYTNTPVGSGSGQVNQTLPKTPEEQERIRLHNEAIRQDWERRKQLRQFTPDEIEGITKAEKTLDEWYKKRGMPNPNLKDNLFYKP
ncbi:hypothetical protein FJZ22_00795 [Candidatus Pacearchaeota archaeon]|nr:hypothetical protein [Candidatus Pacearchaeota archaeon]